MAESPTKSEYNYSSIPEGYYDQITRTGSPIRRAWHLQKFERVVDCIPEDCESVLDIGCFAGTFLSQLPEERFTRQVGVDILQTQIDYANLNFGNENREFVYIPSVEDLHSVAGEFDCITLIEVIEHLRTEEISLLFDKMVGKLKIGGKLIFSTPNYTSTWPALEVVLNKMSTVTYEEQHITKFNYFNVEKKLGRITSQLGRSLEMDFKTTTHFISPFLAGFSLDFSRGVSRLYPHNTWRFPFGNLVLVRLTRVR